MKSALNLMASRDFYQNVILSFMHKHERLSKFDLCKLTKLSTTAITAHIGRMLELGIIREFGQGYSNGGRKPILLELNETFGYFLGIEFSAEGIRTAVLSFKKEVIYHKCVRIDPSDAGAEQVLGMINEQLALAIATSDIASDKILGIGVGLPGYSDYKEGILRFYTQLNSWSNIDVKHSIQQAYDYPIFFTGNINAISFGYRSVFKKGDCEDAVILGVRSGFKVSAIVNNSVLMGSHCYFGEIGHAKVAGSNRTCRCGKHGCYDTEVTYVAICMKAEEGIRVGKFEYLKQQLERENKTLSVDLIIDACNHGDPDCIQLMDGVIAELANAISWINSILDPETLVVVSAFTRYENFIQKLKSVVYHSENEYRREHLALISSPYDDHIAAIGAAAFVYESLYQTDMNMASLS